MAIIDLCALNSVDFTTYVEDNIGLLVDELQDARDKIDLDAQQQIEKLEETSLSSAEKSSRINLIEERQDNALDKVFEEYRGKLITFLNSCSVRSRKASTQKDIITALTNLDLYKSDLGRMTFGYIDDGFIVSAITPKKIKQKSEQKSVEITTSVLDKPIEYSGDLNKNFLLENLPSGVREYVYKQQSVALAKTCIIDCEKRSVVTSNQDLNDRIKQLQNDLVKNIIDLAEQQGLGVEVAKLSTKVMWDANGRYTGLLGELTSITNRLFPKGKYETIDQVYNEMLNSVDNEVVRKNKLAIDGYSSFLILKHFDSFIKLKYGKNIEIINACDGRYENTRYLKYSFASKSQNLKTTWRTTELINLSDEISKIVQEIVTTTPIIGKPNTYLKFNDFCTVIGKLKELYLKADDFVFITLNEDNTKNEDFKNLNSETLKFIEGKSIRELIGSIRTNPRKAISAIIDLLQNDVTRDLIMEHIKYNKSIDSRKVFEDSDILILRSIHHGLTSLNDNDNSLASIAKYNTDLYDLLAQAMDSIYKVNYMQYYKDSNNDTKPRNLQDSEIVRQQGSFSRTIQANNTGLKENIKFKTYGFQNNEKSVDRNLDIDSEKSVYINPLMQSFEENNFRIKVRKDGTVNFEIKENGKWVETNNIPTNLDTQALLSFVSDVIGFNVSTSMYSNFGGDIKPLLHLAGRTLYKSYLAHTLFKNAKTNEDIKNLVATQLEILDVAIAKYFRLNPSTNELDINDGRDLNTIRTLAEAQRIENGTADTQLVKNGEGATLSQQTLSRLLGAFDAQWEYLCKKNESATKDSLILKPGLLVGIYTANEYYDLNTRTSKPVKDFNVKEMTISMFLHDFIDGLQQKDTNYNGIIGNGRIALIPSVNSDKPTIGRLIIDLNVPVQLYRNGKAVTENDKPVMKSLREMTAGEVVEVLSHELGTIYNNIRNNIEADFNTVLQYAKDKGLYDGKLPEEYSGELKFYSEEGFKQFKSDLEKQGGKAVNVLNEIVRQYNLDHRNAPMVLTDLIHFLGNVEPNETLLYQIEKFNALEQRVKSLDNGFKELIKSHNGFIDKGNVKGLTDASFNDNEISLTFEDTITKTHERIVDSHGADDTAFKERFDNANDFPKVEIYNGIWTRADVEAHPDKIYLFGDNTQDRLNGYVPIQTQAVIRGLPNALGIDTKHNRGIAENSYFTDAEFHQFKALVDQVINTAINSGKTIVLPAAGIGTGKAQLALRAPQCFNYLQQQLNTLLQLNNVEKSSKIIANPLATSNTANYGVTIDRNLLYNHKNWLQTHPYGIVAYRVNRQLFNTPEFVKLGIIGNPFDWNKYGTLVCALMFYDWLTTGNNFNEPLANENYRQAIIEKLLHTEEPDILYYKELGMASHATILGYLIKNKHLLTSPDNSINIYAGVGLNVKLSNFAPRPFTISEDSEAAQICNDLGFSLNDSLGNTILFKSVELAFLYIKSFHTTIGTGYDENLDNILENILQTTDGKTLRLLGRSIPNLDQKLWDENKPKIMKALLLDSFSQNPEAYRELMLTGLAKLTHIQDRSSWGQQFPQLLMEVREKLSKKTLNDIATHPSIEDDSTITPQPDLSDSNYKPYVLDSGIILNKELTKATHEIIDWLNNPEIDFKSSWYCLEGKAGVGKTTVARALVKEIKKSDPFAKIGVMATSHKATEVIDKGLSAEESIKDAYAACTIASALGMKYNDETGEFSIDSDPNVKPTIQKLNYIIVDEASMVNSEAISYIISMKNRGAKVIFLGDRGLLPPIEKSVILKDLDSKAFDTPYKSKLLIRVRQGENSPILPYADYFWNNSGTDKPVLNPALNLLNKDILTNEGNLRFAKSFESIRGNLIPAFREMIKKQDPTRIKIVAARNATVNAYNETIHKALFDHELECGYSEGEILMAYGEYNVDRIIGDPQLIDHSKDIHNSEDIVLLSQDSIETDEYGILYANVQVKKGNSIIPARIVLASDRNKYTNIVNNMWATIKTMPKGYAKREAIEKVKLLLSAYLNVKLAYAITSHKSLGSTYQTSVVDVDDILSVGPFSNKTKSLCIYTAITRAKNNAVIIENREAGDNALPILISTSNLLAKSEPFKFLGIIPATKVDKKANAKGSITNKYIGFADGIMNSSTANYASQTRPKANLGVYDANDTIFVSIPGKRGDVNIRTAQQLRTIEEALLALRLGATLITDNIEYTRNSDYNEGEKALVRALTEAGATYTERIVAGERLGVWKLDTIPNISSELYSDPNLITPRTELVTETIPYKVTFTTTDGIHFKGIYNGTRLLTDAETLRALDLFLPSNLKTLLSTKSAMEETDKAKNALDPTYVTDSFGVALAREFGIYRINSYPDPTTGQTITTVVVPDEQVGPAVEANITPQMILENPDKIFLIPDNLEDYKNSIADPGTVQEYRRHHNVRSIFIAKNRYDIKEASEPINITTVGTTSSLHPYTNKVIALSSLKPMIGELSNSIIGNIYLLFINGDLQNESANSLLNLYEACKILYTKGGEFISGGYLTERGIKAVKYLLHCSVQDAIKFGNSEKLNLDTEKWDKEKYNLAYNLAYKSVLNSKDNDLLKQFGMTTYFKIGGINHDFSKAICKAYKDVNKRLLQVAGSYYDDANYSYFTENDYDAFVNHLEQIIKEAKNTGKQLVISSDLYLAFKKLPPKLARYLQLKLNELTFNPDKPTAILEYMDENYADALGTLIRNNLVFYTKEETSINASLKELLGNNTLWINNDRLVLAKFTLSDGTVKNICTRYDFELLEKTIKSLPLSKELKLELDKRPLMYKPSLLLKIPGCTLTVNPLIQKYCALDYLITSEWRAATVGSCLAHPYKLKGDIKQYTKKLIEAARYQAQHKRNVQFTATMQEFSLNCLRGIPSDYNIAVIKDVKDKQYNVSGTETSPKPYDGATFVNPFIVYLENNSLGSAKAGITKKLFVHFYDAHTGNGGIIKTCGFGLTNNEIRNSQVHHTMMEKMCKGTYFDLNGNYLTLDLTKNYKGEDSSLVNSSENLEDEIIFKRNGHYYAIKKIESAGNNRYHVYGTEIGVIHTKEDLFNLRKTAKRLINPNLDLLLDSIFADELDTNGGVLVDNNYALWTICGGENSMHMEQDRTLIPDDSSIIRVSELMNEIGLNPETNELFGIDAEHKAELIFDLNDIYQPLKHSDIHYIVTEGAIKLGGGNFNESSSINKEHADYTDKALNFMKIHMVQAGILLDKEHEADNEELSLMTLVINACAHKGYTMQQAFEMYQSLSSLNYAGTKNLLDPIRKLYSENGKHLNEESFLKLVRESVTEAVVKSMDSESVNDNSLLAIFSQSLIKKLQTGQHLDWDTDILLNFPIDHPSIYKLFMSKIAVFYTRNGIRAKVSGVLAVLNPSYNIMRLYNYYDENGNLRILKYAEASNAEVPLRNELGELMLDALGRPQLCTFDLLMLMSQRHAPVVFNRMIKEDFNRGDLELSKHYIVEPSATFDPNSIGELINQFGKGGEEYLYRDKNGQLIFYCRTPRMRQRFINFLNTGQVETVQESVKEGHELKEKNYTFLGLDGKSYMMYDSDVIMDLFELNNNEKDVPKYNYGETSYLGFKITFDDNIPTSITSDNTINIKYNPNESDTELLRNIIQIIALKLLPNEDPIDATNDFYDSYLIGGKEDSKLYKAIKKNLSKLVRRVTAVLSKNGYQYYTDQTIRINGLDIMPVRETIKNQSYGLVLPKYYATHLGLEPNDLLSYIRKTPDFFSLRIATRWQTDPRTNEDSFTYELKSITGLHKYIYTGILFNFDPNEYIELPLNIIREGDKLVRRDPDGNAIHELSSMGDKIYLNRRNGVEIIQTNNPEFYLEKLNYFGVRLSKSINSESDNKYERLFKDYLEPIRKAAKAGNRRCKLYLSYLNSNTTDIEIEKNKKDLYDKLQQAELDNVNVDPQNIDGDPDVDVEKFILDALELLGHVSYETQERYGLLIYDWQQDKLAGKDPDYDTDEINTFSDPEEIQYKIDLKYKTQILNDADLANLYEKLQYINDSLNSSNLSPEEKLEIKNRLIIAKYNALRESNRIERNDAFNDLNSKLKVLNDYLSEAIDLSTKHPINKFIISQGLRMHASFLKSLQCVVSRTPSQSMQSFMDMEIEAFDDADRNSVYVSTAQIWLLGSDYDVDTASVAMYAINRNGTMDLWSPFADESSLDNLEASMELPFPTGENTETVSGLDLKADERMEFNDSCKDIYSNILQKYSPILRKSLKTIKDAEGKDFQVDTLILDLLKRDANENPILINGLELIDPNKIKLLADFIKQFSGASLPELDVLNYGRIKESVSNDLLTLDIAQSLANILNQHNLNINKWDISKLENASINFTLHSMFNIIADPINLMQAMMSVDDTTGPLKSIGNKQKASELVKDRSEANGFNKAESIEDNMVGKDGIGICATGLKGYFGAIQSCNYILENGTDEEKKSIQLNGKNGITIAGHTYHYLANINQKLDSLISDIQQYILDGEISRALDRLEAVGCSNPNEALQLIQEGNLHTAKDYISKSLEELDDAALVLSALLSLSTDNAKELLLAKLNANKTTISLYIYGIVLGIPFDTLSHLMTSNIGTMIKERSAGNIFAGENNKSLDSIFTYLEKGLNIDSFYSAYDLERIHNIDTDTYIIHEGAIDQDKINSIIIRHLLQQVESEINSLKVPDPGSSALIQNEYKKDLYRLEARRKAIKAMNGQYPNTKKIIATAAWTLSDSLLDIIKLELNELSVYKPQAIDAVILYITDVQTVSLDITYTGGKYGRILKLEYIDIKNLNEGSNEFTSLALNFYNLNLGLKTDDNECIQKIWDLENLILNRLDIINAKQSRSEKLESYRNKDYEFEKESEKNKNKDNSLENSENSENSALLDRFDIRRFFYDEDYRNKVFKGYDLAQFGINILRLGYATPHFRAYLEDLVGTHVDKLSISAKYNAKYTLGRSLKDALNLTTSDDVLYLLKGIENWYNDQTICNWMLELPDLQFKLPKDSKKIINGKEVDNADSSFICRLGTINGNASFKYFMENIVIPDMMKGILRHTDKNVNYNIKDNKFIRSLTTGLLTTNPTHNPIIYYTTSINMLSHNEELELNIRELRGAFNALNAYSYSWKLGESWISMPISDMFFLYTLIAHYGKSGELSLMPLFTESYLDLKGMPGRFKSYTTSIDMPNINSLNALVSSSILPYIIRTLTLNSFLSDYYKLFGYCMNPKTQLVQLYYKPVDESGKLGVPTVHEIPKSNYTTTVINNDTVEILFKYGSRNINILMSIEDKVNDLPVVDYIVYTKNGLKQVLNRAYLIQKSKEFGVNLIEDLSGINPFLEDRISEDFEIKIKELLNELINDC